MEAKTKDLWVFVETKEDGSAKNVGIELLAPGRDIANKQGGSLVALVVGCGVDSLSLIHISFARSRDMGNNSLLK